MTNKEIKKHLKDVITISRIGEDSNEIITDFSNDEIKMLQELLSTTDDTELKVQKEDTGFKKYDKGKTKWSMLPFREVEEIVKIIEFGADKYGEGNWKTCTEPKRYINAAFRHLISYASGKKIDDESGKSHLAHAACNLIFLMYFDNEEKDEDKALEEAFKHDN